MAVLSVIGMILLTLLKIILILLAVVLVLLLIVLILPISYEALGKADGEQGLMGVEARARVKLLLGLVKAAAVFREGTLSFVLKLAGFSLKKGSRRLLSPDGGASETEEPEAFPETEAGGSRETAGDAAEEAAVREAEKSEELQEFFRDEAAEEVEAEPYRVAENPEEEFSGRTAEEETAVSSGPAPQEAEEDSAAAEEAGPDRADRIAELLYTLADRLYEVPEKAGQASDRLYAAGEKLDGLREKAYGIWDQTQDEENRKAFRLVVRQLGKLLRQVLPRQLRVKGVFGTGDPALTGQLLGLFYALTPLYAENWELALAGDFQDKRLAGKAYLTGRIHLIGIAGTALRLLANRRIRQLVRRVIRKGDGDGR